MGRLIGYLKGREKKGIIIRKPKVLKAVMFCDLNYATDKEMRKIVSGLVATLEGTLLMCLSKTQTTVMLRSTEAEYVALSAFTQEVKFVSMLVGEMTEAEKPSVNYEKKQCAIFLEKSRQVVIRTNQIDIFHHFLRVMVEEKDIDIQYIRSEDNPYDTMTKNTSEENLVRNMRRITEGELWELMDTVRENVKNTVVTMTSSPVTRLNIPVMHFL